LLDITHLGECSHIDSAVLIQEHERKGAVVLPWQHQGSGTAYSTDDFRAYLPPAAGGHGSGSGEDGLGHIQYVRDSSESADSDEDPDDDLDI
jgi:hypothetical protein